MTDALQILVRFGGQAHHEIQLHAAPAAFESVRHRADQVGLGNALVDYVPQPLSARLGGQGEARFFHLLRFLQRLLHDVVNAHGGQRNAHPLFFISGHQRGNQLGQAGIIAGGKGGKAHFLIAGGGFQRIGQFQQALHAALPHRAIQHARLAEAAAPGAAPHDFQHDAVVHDFSVGHGDFLGVNCGV